MTQLPPEGLVPNNTLITSTPEEGRALAITLVRHSLNAMQKEFEVLKRGHPRFSPEPFGLMEASHFDRRIKKLESQRLNLKLSQAAERIAGQFRKYILIRSLASILTGFVTFCFALLVGLELALAWGAIFFVLNYVPFLGPLVAVVLATLFAAAQFESWQMALINLAGLSVIQFLIGSYLEPLLAGATLAISPFLVLFAVFFWSFLWGIPGAFIGVPLTIAFLTICEQRKTRSRRSWRRSDSRGPSA